jgi:hypothetical protein
MNLVRSALLTRSGYFGSELKGHIAIALVETAAIIKARISFRIVITPVVARDCAPWRPARGA